MLLPIKTETKDKEDDSFNIFLYNTCLLHASVHTHVDVLHESSGQLRYLLAPGVPDFLCVLWVAVDPLVQLFSALHTLGDVVPIICRGPHNVALVYYTTVLDHAGSAARARPENMTAEGLHVCIM